ncbi:MAG: 50S ribosomal protein L22 [Chloroherpetonaceae bacterium]|nr:50S ribosomal protein L22 [Chloroherpetonaceae bacterium]MDW8437483.1 50S ribosomal protein L22 [Chloroherpetonaceae bacterium]
MSVRKREVAEARKEKRAKESKARAIWRNVPTSPRKMRLVVDLVRGKSVSEAQAILQNLTKHAARTVLQTLKSAVSNYMQKHSDRQVDENRLFIVEAFVDGGATLKRILPAPMGRAYRIRKRSNHLTIVVDEKRVQS